MVYHQEKEEVIEQFQTDAQKGLSDAEVQARLAKYGKNEIAEEKKDSLFIKFLKQLKDPLILILIAAAIISVIADPHEWIDSVVICVVVLFNCILGVVQENNAEKSLEALKKMSAPNAKVIRNGVRVSVPSDEVVVGDIIILEAGDYVASDGRILEAHQLQIDESALTGESVPVEKSSAALAQEEVALGDQVNMVFASTVCTYGRGKFVVTSTGMQNEVGKIADMLMQGGNETTPLQQKLAQISKVIGMMCIVICIVVFGLEMLSGLSILDSFKTAVALAVAAIPEGLSTVVTIVLALGVTKMVKKNAIVRKLPAVETLGSASVVCSDKTGTLTQNKMTVTHYYLEDTGTQPFKQEGQTEVNQKSEEVRTLFRYFSLASDAEIRKGATENQVEFLGDPTETCLVEASYLLGDDKDEVLQHVQRVAELAFDSDRKMMTVFYQYQDELISITKGAPDVVLSRSLGTHEEALKANEQMADKALRVLAVAIRKWEQLPEDLSSEQVEQQLTFVGLAGMIDPPRLEVKSAIEQAKQGGVRTVMITGDHLTTACAIARDLGILTEDKRGITGAQLNEMSDEELDAQIEQIAVYARVAPEHKVRIVKAWQKRDEVVAMTGDGVNDSPALKAADIGCAMGITGTDVSKGAADMILTDDNFATIISAVKEGRGIYNNIKKDVHFLLSSNIGEVITIFLASLVSLIPSVHLGVPLMPIHLLWVNLITDTLPAFALGMEEPDEDIMKQKPRPKSESFFAGGLGFKIAWQGLMIGLLTLSSYAIGNQVSHEIGMTMAFVTLSMTQLFHSFNIKSDHSIFHRQIFNNKYLWGSFILGFVLQLIVLYSPLAQIFQVVALPLEDLGLALGIAMLPIPIVELSKLISKK